MAYKLNPFTGEFDKVSSDTVTDESFTPTNGQTSFVLSAVPTNNSDVIMFVNNAAYLVGDNFSISGVTITWFDDFTIASTDIITIRYPV